LEHKQSKPTVTKAHVTTLNLNNFKIIEAMGLKLLHRDPLEWHYLRTKFHEILPSGSKVISGGPTDRLAI
jgi:PIN domain nuclease of toxin-antitoxin system